MKLCMLLMHTDGKGFMKTITQTFYTLLFFILTVGCTKEEVNTKSTQYILKTEVWPSSDHGKIIPSQGNTILYYQKSMRDPNRGGFLIAGKGQ